MSTETLTQNATPMTDRAHTDHHQADHSHDASSNKIFGFWIYLMSDCILFAVVFAVYAVLVNNVVDGPTGKEIFNLPYVLVQTFCLLISSLTYGMAMLALVKRNKAQVLRWLALTFLFGLIFVVLEVNEFHLLISEGYGPQRSAFLSAFFALVGTHGLHVTFGLGWMAVLMVQISRKGLTAVNNTRLMCLSLFWHFLDIVWICLFTVVYLMGAM